MSDARPIAGSFRDPAGHVFEVDGRIYRTVNHVAANAYETLRDNGVLSDMIDAGWLISATEVEHPLVSGAESSARYVVEHPKLTFISHPYEWCFSALKRAAVFHLDFQLALLERDAVLSDASAYNVQFDGTRPYFIDFLSLRPYRDGEYWTGHRQFCEQFLNPLLIFAKLGIAPNAWYRGGLEGISTTDLVRILPWTKRLSWNAFSHVTLQASLQNKSISNDTGSAAKPQTGKKLSKTAYRGLLQQLRNWIAKLTLKQGEKTVWGDYADSHSYDSDEDLAKRRFVGEFVEATKPDLLWDLGCNTGEYSSVALSAGAGRVIGFDFDHGALNKAFARGSKEGLKFQALFLDAANPSPDQGWQQRERQGMAARARADAILALAFEHHLAIGRNVPIDQTVSWLVGLAPHAVIEFVEKSDPTVQQMLAFREDIFPDYSKENFANALARHATIVKSEVVSASGRTLFWCTNNV